MKYLLIIVLFFTWTNLQAQQKSNPCPRYNTLIKAGLKSLDSLKYEDALNSFLGAQIAARECGSNADLAYMEIKKVFDLIQEDRKNAVDAENDAKKQKAIANRQKAVTQVALEKAKNALAKADSSNKKNEKLVNAFYFYKRKLALAFKDDQFYFIDTTGDPYFKNKNGDPVQFDKAEQFDYTGFARVSVQNPDSTYTDYLLDTNGIQYKVAHKLDDLKVNEIYEAVDIRNSHVDSFPTEMLSQNQLKIFIAENVRKNIKDWNTFKIPSSIRQLQNLEYISIYRFNLNPLPNEFGQLKSLKFLDLSGSQLHSLPPSFGELNNLGILDLSGTQLDSLPQSFGEMNKLDSLDLSGNQLHSLPPSFGELKKLRILDLSRNQLDSLPQSFGDLRNLEYLDLSRNHLHSLPQFIEKLKSLRYLNLLDNPIAESEKQRMKILLSWCQIEF